MIHITKKDIRLFGIQASIGAGILLTPALTALLTARDLQASWETLLIVWKLLRPAVIIYFVNYYLFVPFFLERKPAPRARFWQFIAANALLIVICNCGFFFPHPEVDHDIPREAILGFYAGLFVYFLLNVGMVFAAIGVRHRRHLKELREQLRDEQQRNTEAELAWLKNQLNPHFLFNTLNNISSLTQIDPDRAQDSIAQLSDLLRYALYETQKETVPLHAELDFMRNYIELMRMRCNDQTTVDYRFDIHHKATPIAPLLFLSPIENAFKHGTSSSKPSFIRIRLEERSETDKEHSTQLLFTCENSNYAKGKSDHSGSGIGLENLRRRLELIYPGAYQLKQQTLPAIYRIEISIVLNTTSPATNHQSPAL